MAKIVGYFNQSVIDLLKLNHIPPQTPIMIGDTNIEHIKNRHPYEYDRYFRELPKIISAPDYVGINPSDSSISFVKNTVLSQNISELPFASLPKAPVLSKRFIC